jgi:hypothetical protein
MFGQGESFLREFLHFEQVEFSQSEECGSAEVSVGFSGAFGLGRDRLERLECPFAMNFDRQL